jgi:acyl carrier protein
MYGITETTVHSTYRPIRLADLERPRSPIGCPLPDLSIRILGAGDGLAPIGVPGEICVGGEGVARGYWKRPALTAERFVPDPIGNGRLYRSGDLGRYTPDGDLEYLGRIDHQVKIRGFRVELGEIEAALLSQESVRQALVVAETQSSGYRLVAYVVNDAAADVLVIRQRLRERLPEYMIPALILPVPVFPLTAHGKIDRNALATLARTPLRTPLQASRPFSDSELLVSGILKDLLGISHIEPNDNFFDLGANSLLLVRLHSELQVRLGRRIPLTALYRYPSLEALAAHLSSAESAPGESGSDEGRRRGALRRTARKRDSNPSGRGAGA